MPYAFGLRYATGAGNREGRRALRGSGRRKPLTTDMAGDRPCSRQGTPYRWRRSGALTGEPTPTGRWITIPYGVPSLVSSETVRPIGPSRILMDWRSAGL